MFIDKTEIYGIAVDPEKGLLYFTNYGHGVEVVNLDNKLKHTFIRDNHPIGIVLDLINR